MISGYKRHEDNGNVGMSKLMPKVLVAQYTHMLDFSEANKYGEVKFLTDREYAPEPTPPGHNDSIRDEIIRNLKDYVPGHDFIVTTGSSLPNVIVGMAIAKIPGKHKFLKWNGRDRTYGIFIVSSI